MRFRRILLEVAVSLGVAMVIATPSVAEASNSSIVYDIPAQALDKALNKYISLSRAQVFYETVTTSGRRSTALIGRFTSIEALRTLLIGTGLASRQADVDAFVVAPAPESEEGTSSSALGWDDPFLVVLQKGILKTLCAYPQTRPGSYRVALEIWISPTGAIQRSDLIGSTGIASRDSAVGKALQDVSVGMAPPANIPQPFVMTINGRPENAASPCGTP